MKTWIFYIFAVVLLIDLPYRCKMDLWKVQVRFISLCSTIKVGVGSLSLASSGKSSTRGFQHFVIQLVWNKTRLLHHSLALYSDHFPLANGKWSEYTASWLAVETSDMTHVLKLASGDSSVSKQHRQPAWVELRWISLHRCNVPCNHLVSSWIFGQSWTCERRFPHT